MSNIVCYEIWNYEIRRLFLKHLIEDSMVPYIFRVIWMRRCDEW